MERRDFIRKTALASSLMMVPSFVKAFDSAYLKSNGYKRLVVIQLSGGNDGLNTVIPYTNDFYFNARPRIAIKDGVLKLNDILGLNPSLQPLKELYDQGELSIINNVGYPNPIRSHFESMDVWHTASDSNKRFRTGWIGRFLDSTNAKPFNAIEIDETLSLAMKGQKNSGIAIPDFQRFYKTSRDPFFNKIITAQSSSHLSEHNLGYLYQTMIDAKSSADYIFEKTKTKNSKTSYPQTPFAKQLRQTATFINSHLETKVYYNSLSGFDTHANQLNPQKRLLSTYAEAVDAFVKDLKRGGTFNDTLILTFSEFGRRVKQNAGNGTDHGAASNVFIIGGQLRKPGFYNDLASLDDLDSNGDLKYTVDFRSVYSTLLEKWFLVPKEPILGSSYPLLNIL